MYFVCFIFDFLNGQIGVIFFVDGDTKQRMATRFWCIFNPFEFRLEFNS